MQKTKDHLKYLVQFPLEATVALPIIADQKSIEDLFEIDLTDEEWELFCSYYLNEDYLYEISHAIMCEAIDRIQVARRED